jgi:hypothetical protein
MKGKSVAVIALMIFALPSVAQTVDEQEIVTVLAKETAIRHAFSFDDWSAQWSHEDFCLMIGHNFEEAPPVLEGWEQIAEATRYWMETTDRIQYQIDRSNWVIRIEGKIAYATFDQVLTVADEPATEYRTKEVRVLEKVYGRWKVTLLHSIPR